MKKRTYIKCSILPQEIKKNVYGYGCDERYFVKNNSVNNEECENFMVNFRKISAKLNILYDLENPNISILKKIEMIEKPDICACKLYKIKPDW